MEAYKVVGNVLDSSRGDTITCHQIRELGYKMSEDAGDDTTEFTFPARAGELDNRYGDVLVNGATLGDYLEPVGNQRTFETVDNVKSFLAAEITSLEHPEKPGKRVLQ